MLIWHDTAWADYLYWQKKKKKTLKRINQLIKNIERNGNEGIGKPEPLKENLTGFWSRRIDERHRVVYRIVEETGDIQIAQCKGHYADE